MPTPRFFRTAVVSSILLVCRAQPLVSAEVRLEDLDISLIKLGWGTPQAGKSVAEKPLAIGNELFAHGVGVHSPSTGTILLDGNVQSFRARVGINDDSGGGLVEFRVLGDGKALYLSGPVRGGEKSREVNVPLKGIRRLTLEVDALGDNFNDHADWAEAVITYPVGKPAILDPDAAFSPAALYPPADKLIVSPGNTTYFVNPNKGDDARNGTTPGAAWKSIARINAMKLAPGDKVMIAPGPHEETLKPSGEGTATSPIEFVFTPGMHEFAAERAIRLPMFVSNSCDAPKVPSPIGIMVRNAKHMHLKGTVGKTTILFGGRMVEFFNDHSENITYSGLAFDLKRPTVSEFRVMETTENSATVRIAEGSTFSIANRKFTWTGDLGSGSLMVQQAIPAEGKCWRVGNWDPFSSAAAEDMGNGKVRLTYAKGRCDMEAGRQYQFRRTTRDVVSAHNNRCSNITIRDCDFHALTGMGIVSQFTDGVTYVRVRVAPPEGTLRTCPAWADAFHFSGCRGRILVDRCVFSGTQDDPINVHGTHLRIIGKPTENQLLVRFMHPQTYGFAAFAPGDEVAVIHHENLREYPGNPRRKVTAVERGNDKDWLLTLDGPSPSFGNNDVLDNISWYPDVRITNCRVDMDSCRGFLLTTRGRVLVERNTFTNCAMPAILIEDDAEGWFESGPVRDMTIRHNKFLNCGISINPQTRSTDPEEPVHENIRIENNFFQGAGISAKSTKGLVVTGNSSSGGSFSVNAAPSCGEVNMENNAAKATASSSPAGCPPM